MPKMVPNRKRVIQLNFRVSPEELKIIEEKMKQYGTTNREAMLRKLIIEGYVIRFDMPELKEILRLLRYMGNNINQLTRRVHETARIYDEDIAEIRKKQDEICKGVRGILSQLSKLSEA